MANIPEKFASSVVNLASQGYDALNKNLSQFGIDSPGNLNGKDYTLSQGEYDFTYRVFPADIGEQSYNGHYMVININVSNFSSLDSVTYTPTGDNVRDSTNNVLFTRTDELSKTDALRFSIEQQFTTNGKPIGRGSFSLPRQTRRIKESIALFMPPTATYSQVNEYEDIHLTDIIVNPLKSILNAASPGLGETGGGLQTTDLLNIRFNPRLEIVYSSTPQRQFQFDFLCAPTTIEESQALEQIIRTLRFHAAPEENNFGIGSGNIGSQVLDVASGLFWIPPSEFDITFYNKGQENLSIPRINTCVLESIDVDYAPTGVYSTFSNGYPVKTRLMLKFRETAILSKDLVLLGF